MLTSIPSEDIIILVCFDGYRYYVSLCAVCKKAELVEKKRWTVFPMVCWTAGICSLAGCVQGQGCMEPIVPRDCADPLPDVLAADSGCQQTLFLSILPGRHSAGKQGSCSRTQTFSPFPFPLSPLPRPLWALTSRVLLSVAIATPFPKPSVGLLWQVPQWYRQHHAAQWFPGSERG